MWHRCGCSYRVDGIVVLSDVLSDVIVAASVVVLSDDVVVLSDDVAVMDRMA